MAGLDHINIRIPSGREGDALSFYRDVLGLEPMRLGEYRADERTTFFVRLGEDAVINVRPVDDFEPPTGRNYDHFCIVLDMTIEELDGLLEEHGIGVLREGTPLGATGRGPARYVEDPFGYVIELKAGRDVAD